MITRFDVVEPDLLYLSNERAAEVLTTPTSGPGAGSRDRLAGHRKRDETIKRRLYERAGVAVMIRRSWMSSGFHAARGKALREALELSRETGEVLSTPLLPGLELSLNRIFRD